MRKMILLCLMFFVMFAAGCTSHYGPSEHDGQFLEAVPYPDSTEILYKEEADGMMLYFYKDETGFRHSVISSNGNIMLNSDAVELDPKDGMNFTIHDAPELHIIILAGVISNEKIQTISLKQNGIENYGMIIEPKKGSRIWYVIFERTDLNFHMSKEPFKIEGLSDEGNVLWEDEVFLRNAYKWGS